MLKRVSTVADVRHTLSNWQKSGQLIGLVPTMGNLHAGHLSLVQQMKNQADRTVVSIFVNPAQFGEQEDFGAYPRTLEEDCAKLSDAGADLVFMPTPAEIYPEGFKTSISVGDIATRFEGKHRPGHFEGVATVVAKLLLQTGADKAIFGEKDLQQLAVIRRMVSDLNINCQILAGPLVRDSHGLALSSRNGYLSGHELAIARQLNLVLKDVVTKAETADDLRQLEKDASDALQAKGFSSVDYVTIIDRYSFEPLATIGPNAHVICTARIGSVRLLDNMPIRGPAA